MACRESIEILVVAERDLERAGRASLIGTRIKAIEKDLAEELLVASAMAAEQ